MGIRLAWLLLTRRQKQKAALLLVISVLAAFANIAMVASLVPIITVLTKPKTLDEDSYLNAIYQYLNFTSSDQFVVFLGVAFSINIIVMTFIIWQRIRIVTSFCQSTIHELSSKIWSSFITLEYESLSNLSTSEISSRVLSESEQVVSKYYRPVCNFFAAVVSLIITAVFLIWYSWQATLLTLAIFILLFSTIFLFFKVRLESDGSERARQNRKRFDAVSESLNNITSIKFRAAEQKAIQNYKVASKRMAELLINARLIELMPGQVLQSGAYIGIILSMCIIQMYSSGNFLDEQMVVDLSVFLFAAQRSLPDINRVYASLSQAQFGKAVLNDIDITFKKYQPTASSNGFERSLVQFENNIVLNAVSKSFGNRNSPSVNSIFLEIKKGEKIGLVGENGSGKSTLIKIIIGLLKPDSGCVLIDGIPVNDNVRSFHIQKTSYVSQNIELFNHTIKANIVFDAHDSEFDQSRFDQACKASGLHRVIKNFERGVETTVGENGMALSGGERQMLSIARELYSRHDFLILDEATSALDSDMEAEILRSLKEEFSDVTLIMIGHGKEFLSICDKIIVMSNGKAEVRELQ